MSSKTPPPNEIEAHYDERDALIAARDQARDELDAAQARMATLVEALHGENEARLAAEKQLFWASSELQGIKSSTGWALLQFLYRVRFLLFPRGSVRESLAKLVMRIVRQARRFLRRPAVPTGVPSPAGPVETGRTVPIRSSIDHERATIVCLPIVEWNFRFQRPQQLARRFAKRGHEVIFVRHTFGATLTPTSLEERIEQVELPGTAGTNPYRDRLVVSEAERMAEALLAHLASRRLPCFTCIVQLPFWAPLASILRERGGCEIVYDCMDLHAGFASNTSEALADEQRLVAEADLVVVSSDRLRAEVAPGARRTALVRNGVDYEHFAADRDRSADPAKHCTIGYFGAIADWFDSGLVAAIARMRPEWQIVLIGDTWSADKAPLESAGNVTLAGEKRYDELPSLIMSWDCCIIPFLHTPLTEATNPVKVYEMLAAGKPVVSVALPELEPMRVAGLVAIAEGAPAFVAAIEAELKKDGEPARAMRRAYARANTWESRQQAMARSIEELRPLVSVVIVTFHNRALNELCLESVLHDTDYPSYEVIVVDNGSTDGTPEMLREVAARDSRVRLILNPDNRGFAIATNQGAAIARGSMLCFLNNDTVVHGAWLSTLVGHLRQHPRLGLVGPVTNAISNEARIAVGYDDVAQMPEWADVHCQKHRGVLEEISMLAFFCVVVPRWAWRVVGPLDERFGVGMFEDDDYNRRVRDAGFEVRVAWDSFVHHWQGASFKLISEDEYLGVYRENRRRYLEKWDEALSADDDLAPLRHHASVSRGVVIFAPSVGWQIHLAQRPHHLARVLASEGYVVVFDCSDAADEVEVIREVEPRLYLYKDRASRLADLPRITLWTFSYNYDYRDHFGPGISVVYDWIDDLSVFPYEPAKLEALHSRALREADVVTCVARRLHDQALATRPDARYVPNAVEEGRFDREPDRNPALADPMFAGILAKGKPIAGYYGALARWFDYELVRETARLRPDWSFVLIGPDHDGSLARSKLDRLPNVHCLGPRPYLALPGYLHRFDAATIPFAVDNITLATSPLKLYEYFAAGRPVISTPMPECAAFPEVRIVRNASDYAAALDDARRDACDPQFRARLTMLAAQNTWRARAREAMQALEERRAGKVAATADAPRAHGDAAPLSDDARALMQRFAKLETAANRHFFRALAAHLAGSRDDPCLPMYFEFALSANERGREAAALIESIVPLAGKRTLDVGCAYGGFLVALAERGAEATGMDIDDSLLALAGHNFRDVGRSYPVHRADVTKTDDVAAFHDAFDVISCNDVIEHVSDPAVTVGNIASMLSSDGLAYFEIPNRDDVAAVMADGHYQLFGITQLDREAAGRYYAAHAPGVRYGVEHYLRLDEYRTLFHAAGLSVALLEDAQMPTVDNVRASLAALRNALPVQLQQVPRDLRDEVERAVIRYLDEADRAPCSAPDEQRAFLLRYGVGFWRIAARKPGVAAVTRTWEATPALR